MNWRRVVRERLDRAPALRVLGVVQHGAGAALLDSLAWEEGYVTTRVEGTAGAVDAFHSTRPDIVLVFLSCATHDCLDVVRSIKAEPDAAHVPVLFVSDADDDVVQRGVDAGADGFLSASTTPRRLQSLLRGIRRLTHATHELQAQRIDLRRQRNALVAEHELARRIFASLLGDGGLDAPNLRHLLQPASTFAGDVILAARTPFRTDRVLVGDFTGHGLAAALGALPVSNIFKAMSAKGYDSPRVLCEINRVLHETLPRGMFLAAACAELDARTGQLQVWNGGLPDGLVVKPDSGLTLRFESRHPPLGILSPAEFDAVPAVAEIERDDRLYLYTDGVTERQDRRGRMFGEARLEEVLEGSRNEDDAIEGVRAALDRFAGGTTAEDDVAIIELRCARPAPLRAVVPFTEDCACPHACQRGSVEITVESAMLRHIDPLPVFMHMMMDMPPARGLKERLSLVVGELVRNAVEHGVLQLTDTRETGAAGFADYYRRLDEARSELEDGWIRFNASLTCGGPGGFAVVVELSDSGPGFDFDAVTPSLEENLSPHGRGLALVREVCDSLSHDASTNTVRAVLAFDPAECRSYPGPAVPA